MADAVRTAQLGTVFASGRGVHNPALLARILALAPETRFASTTELGVGPNAKEAAASGTLERWPAFDGFDGS